MSLLTSHGTYAVCSYVYVLQRPRILCVSSCIYLLTVEWVTQRNFRSLYSKTVEAKEISTYPGVL